MLPRIAPLILVLLVAATAVAEPTVVFDTPLSHPTDGATPTVAEPNPYSESELLSDLADGQLDQFPLLEAALIIGGTKSRDSMQAARRRWNSINVELESVSSPAATAQENAANVFRFMHERILTGEYSVSCNALQRALYDGDYNCVTATILYCCLANHCDLSVRPVSVPGHVRCRLIDNPPRTIETTDPVWRAIDAANDCDVAASIQSGRVLNPVQLLAKLFYNRGLTLLSERQFEQALVATELSWQLDPQHDAAGENVATVINNWALVLCAEGHFSQSLQLLGRGQQLVPDHPILYGNQAHILAAWARHRATTPSE
jgi:tetratricopeptide (TPR) repeat protein